MSDVRPLWSRVRGCSSLTSTATIEVPSRRRTPSRVFVATVGTSAVVAQVNTSVSRRGTLRGLHYSVAPPARPSTSPARPAPFLTSSSTCAWAHRPSVRMTLSSSTRESRGALFLSEGLGHAFFALTDEAVVTYFCSSPYAPQHEFTVSALDPALAFPGRRSSRRTSCGPRRICSLARRGRGRAAPPDLSRWLKFASPDVDTSGGPERVVTTPRGTR